MNCLAEILYDYIPLREAMILSVCCADRTMVALVHQRASTAARTIQRAWRRARHRLAPLGHLATWWRDAQHRMHHGHPDVFFVASVHEDVSYPLPHLTMRLFNTNDLLPGEDILQRHAFLSAGNISPPYRAIPLLHPRVVFHPNVALFYGEVVMGDTMTVHMPPMTEDEYYAMEFHEIHDHYRMHVLLTVAGIYAMFPWNALLQYFDLVENPSSTYLGWLVESAVEMVRWPPFGSTDPADISQQLRDHIIDTTRRAFEHAMFGFDHGFMRVYRYISIVHNDVPWRTDTYPTEAFAKDLYTYLTQLADRGVRRPSITQWMLFWQRYPTWILERVLLHKL